VTDVAVSNGILIVMYSMGLVRLYNFQAILEQVMKYKIFHAVDGILGQQIINIHVMPHRYMGNGSKDSVLA